MDIISTDYVWKNTLPKRENYFLLPESIRGLCIGRSGSGKTTLINNLLLKPNLLDYDCLYVFGNSLHQMEYKIMKAAFDKKLSKEQLNVIFSNQYLVNKQGGPLEVIENYDQECKGNIEVNFYKSCDSVPDPSALDETKKNVLIFDDCMLENQAKTSTYFTRSRHNNCCVFYLSQSYFHLPRHSIRENSNFIILFRQSIKNLQHLYQDIVAHDGIPFKAFVNDFCNASWDESKHSFVTIDLSRTMTTGKYRKRLDWFWFPADITV